MSAASEAADRARLIPALREAADELEAWVYGGATPRLSYSGIVRLFRDGALALELAGYRVDEVTREIEQTTREIAACLGCEGDEAMMSSRDLVGAVRGALEGPVRADFAPDWLQARLAEVPAEPAWVRDAAIRALLDGCDYTDREEVEAIIGPLTDEQHARLIPAAEAYIQTISEIVKTEGWRTFAQPRMGE